MLRKHSWSAMALGLLALGAWGCSDAGPTNPTGAPTMDRAPHLLSWASDARPQFGVEGMNQAGSVISAAVMQAPATVDQSSSATATASALSWTHTVGTGANRLLVVGVSVENSKTVQAVSFRGVPLTFLGARSGWSGLRAELWYLKAPASGVGTVSVTLSGSASVVGGAVSFFGTNQVTPVGSLIAANSTGTIATVAAPSGTSDLVLSVLAIDGNAAARTPSAGQTARWSRISPSSDVAGDASTSPGGPSAVIGWTASSSQPWALAAAAIRPVPVVALSQYQATFWAKRGVSRSLQINYAAGGGTSPFMKLTISDPTYVPGVGSIAMGDSVLVMTTVDPSTLAVSLEPHGMQFGTASQLKLWYSGAGGDLNGDGVVNADDTYIENQLLGMWYRPDALSSWQNIPATQNQTEKSFTSLLSHFSQYAVAW